MCHLRCLTVFPKTRRFRRLRRPGSSRHRASPWAAPVPPTERAGLKGSVLCCLSVASPPLVAGATTDKRVLKIDGAFIPRVHCATACGGKVVRSTKGGGLWYRLTAMSIKCCLRQHPLWWLAPPPSPAKAGALWVLGSGGNLSLWQQRRENHTTGLRPEENKPTALAGDGNAPLLPPVGDVFPGGGDFSAPMHRDVYESRS